MSSYDTIMLKHCAKIFLTLLKTAAVHLGVSLSLSLLLCVCVCVSVCLSVSLCGMKEWLLMYGYNSVQEWLLLYVYSSMQEWLHIVSIGVVCGE